MVQKMLEPSGPWQEPMDYAYIFSAAPNGQGCGGKNLSAQWAAPWRKLLG
jgi:hypothetical protein